MLRHWLIIYQCSGTAAMQEMAYHGTLGQWRINTLKYKDGPYILLAAHKITPAEFEKLNGKIG